MAEEKKVIKNISEMKGIIFLVGRFAIREVGVAKEVWSMRKRTKKDGSTVREPGRVASHAYLSWCFDTIIRVGNKAEKNEARILQLKIGK